MSDISLELTNIHGMRLQTDGKYCDGNIIITPTLEDKTVTENGIYMPGTGYAGIGSITVNTQGGTMQSKSVTLGSSAPATTTPDQGYAGLSSVSYTVDSSMIKSSNIKKDATILGVSGDSMVLNTYIGSIGATASDILSGKRAYVNGQEIIGTGTGGGGTQRDEDDIDISSGIVSLPSGQYDPSTVDKITWDKDSWGLETHQYAQYITLTKVSNQYVPANGSGLAGGSVKVGGTSYTIPDSWVESNTGYVVLNSGYWGLTAIFVNSDNVLINGEYYTKGTYFVTQNNSLFPSELTLASGSNVYTQAAKRVLPASIINTYITFTAVQANSTIELKSSGTWSVDWDIWYSTDNTTWNAYTMDTTITLSAIGDYVSFAGMDNASIGTQNQNNYHQFAMSGKLSCSGNIYSLYSQFKKGVPEYAFYNLFRNCTSLQNAPVLDVTYLSGSCYRNMFYGCTSITTAPALPATTLAQYCYGSMFYGCTSLVTPPSLTATTLASYCYYSMFQGCTSLATAPSLPATSLDSSCYYNMFSGCTSLVTAPSLSATTLQTSCYRNMFNGCTALTNLVALPATTLVSYCYYGMFQGCSNIMLSTTRTGDYQNAYRIPTTETGTTVTNALNNMFTGTGGTFTGTPSINTTYYTSNTIVS